MANLRAPRRSGFIQRGGVRRRESLWLSGVFADTQLAAGSTATLVTSLNAAALALRPFTVVRTRGWLGIRTDQTGASEDFQANFGIAVVSDQAVAIGITAIPTPVTDSGSDLWFAFEPIAGEWRLLTAVGVYLNNIGRPIDSRAMRKVEDGQDIVDVIETSAISGGVFMTTFNRTLIKLH